MPRNSDPSRIYHDPALTDRRGDATGPVALLFLVLIVAAFAAVTYGLVTYLPVAADPTPRPTPTTLLASPTPTPQPTATPAPTSAPESAAPSTEPGATDEPGTTAEPLPSREPRASDEPLPSREPEATPASRPRTGTIDETIPVIKNGKRIGSVRMSSFATGDVVGVDLPAGARFMVMEVTYATAFGMPYDAADWVAVGTDGTRYPSLGPDAPDPALGSGRLDADGTITGNVAFIRERKVAIAELILTDGAGKDLVVIERPTTTP